MLTERQIAARLAEVRARIADAAADAGRRPDSVVLVLAGKSQPPEALAAAQRAGARDFGENYVQEAVRKRGALSHLSDVRWHLIGHLQTNKARLAVQTFHLIQTLDSERLARALARAAGDRTVRVLVEVNVAAEASKSGVAPGEAEPLIDAARSELDVAGLMTIPPPTTDLGRARSYFAELRELRDRLAAATGLALSELSMGMSDDFEAAIAEGATIVRIGRAVFGERARR